MLPWAACYSAVPRLLTKLFDCLSRRVPPNDCFRVVKPPDGGSTLSPVLVAVQVLKLGSRNAFGPIDARLPGRMARRPIARELSFTAAASLSRTHIRLVQKKWVAAATQLPLGTAGRVSPPT